MRCPEVGQTGGLSREFQVLKKCGKKYERKVRKKCDCEPKLEKVGLKRDLDENMNDQSPTKRPRLSAQKPVAEAKKPRRSTRNTAKRRQLLARAERRRETQLSDSKQRRTLEIAAQKLFEKDDVINFMDIVNL